MSNWNPVGYIWTGFRLFYLVIHDNLSAGVTRVSNNKKECYEPIHKHTSYFNLMGQETETGNKELKKK